MAESDDSLTSASEMGELRMDMTALREGNDDMLSVHL